MLLAVFYVICRRISRTKISKRFDDFLTTRSIMEYYLQDFSCSERDGKVWSSWLIEPSFSLFHSFCPFLVFPMNRWKKTVAPIPSISTVREFCKKKKEEKIKQRASGRSLCSCDCTETKRWIDVTLIPERDWFQLPRGLWKKMNHVTRDRVCYNKCRS